jgi:hypothetical protein
LLAPNSLKKPPELFFTDDSIIRLLGFADRIVPVRRDRLRSSAR